MKTPRDIRVLIGCEFSGIVRDEFRALGFDAISCDLLPSEAPGPHIQEDIRNHLTGYDALIAHPPCTHLAVSGARWFKEKKQEQKEAIEFVELLWDSSISCIAIENPIGVLTTKSKLGKPRQIIQPWQFGHGEVKATCWWLKNLPSLVPTEIVSGRTARVHRESPGPDRWKNRSRTYKGLAKAMAEQWGKFIVKRINNDW